MQHLSEASRIPIEAVKNKPCENKVQIVYVIGTVMSTLSSCRRNCETYRRKFMALQRQVRLVKIRSAKEPTPASRKKFVKKTTKLMVEKYHFQFVCHNC